MTGFEHGGASEARQVVVLGGSAIGSVTVAVTRVPLEEEEVAGDDATELKVFPV
jgi:hypothetical protein